MARVLMLDIGGVFYRGWPQEPFWSHWCHRLDLDRATLEKWLSSGEDARLARLGQITADDYYARAAAKHGAAPSTFKALLEDAYTSEFNSRLADCVRTLRSRGLESWALTNSLSSETTWMQRPGFEGLFAGVISSCDCGLAKPDPEIFAFAARRAGADPHEILFIDDMADNVAAARVAGFHAIIFDDTETIIEELSRRW